MKDEMYYVKKQLQYHISRIFVCAHRRVQLSAHKASASHVICLVKHNEDRLVNRCLKGIGLSVYVYTIFGACAHVPTLCGEMLCLCGMKP